MQSVKCNKCRQLNSAFNAALMRELRKISKKTIYFQMLFLKNYLIFQFISIFLGQCNAAMCKLSIKVYNRYFTNAIHNTANEYQEKH